MIVHAEGTDAGFVHLSCLTNFAETMQAIKTNDFPGPRGHSVPAGITRMSLELRLRPILSHSSEDSFHAAG